MADASPPYDPRYLAGVVLFNRRDFFEAHEVWESLWLSAEVGTDRRFVQGLIQAAVALYHFGTNNPRGARKLFQTARAYMEAYPPPHLGLDHRQFWSAMERCFEPILQEGREGPLDERTIPVIELAPTPTTWPAPEEFLREEE